MKNVITGNYSCKTDVGRVRITNEDQALALTNPKGRVLLVVCDGMGGQSHGELASRIAITTLANSFSESPILVNQYFELAWLRKVIKAANKQIFNMSQSNKEYHGMGSTITAVLVSSDHIVIGHVGDSRAYILKDGEFEQLTEDQTYVAYLVRSGQLKPEEALTHPKRHVLNNALGTYPSLSLDLSVHKYNGEQLLLCSDGLYNNVDISDISTIVKTDDSPQQKCDQLISLANANGGSDNIAVVVWEANR